MTAATALERLLKGGDLPPEHSLGELGQDLRVVGALHQGGVTGDPEDLRGDRGELDPYVLEDLLDTPLALIYLLAPEDHKRFERFLKVLASRGLLRHLP